jgi:hypothetical protein
MTPRPPPASPRRTSLAAGPLAAALALALAGCATTKISRTWSDPELAKGRFQKPMVLVVVAKEARRETAEDHVVAELAREGVAAMTSWDALKADDLGDRERLAAAVGEKGADALLVVKLASLDRQYEERQGREEWVPVGTGIDAFGYVVSAYGLYRKPEATELRVFSIETSLWDVASKKMMWACQSDTESAKQTLTTAELADDYAGVVAKKVVPYLKKK